QYIEKVDTEKLLEGAIKGMVESLNDPYSRWLSSEEWEKWKVEKEGEFGGVGMSVGIRDGFITVIDPLENTPASKAGLRAGDRIIKINGIDTQGMSLDEAVSLLRGEVGTQVKITIKREGIPEPLEFTLTRELIKLPNLKTQILEGVGYIKITGFTNENTSHDLRTALADFKRKGIKSLILDLRDNPGGLLSQAVEVADEFLNSGTIVSIRGRDPAENLIYTAHEGGEGIGFSLVVLVNQGSASASEIVAGAIKDHRRGILLGTSTFGKGTVQNAVPLENGSALWLTTAKYYTPSGICIEGVGIKPDLEIKPFVATPEEEEIIDNLRQSLLVENFLLAHPDWEKEDLAPLLSMLEERENLKVKEDILRRVLREKDTKKENDIFNDYQVVQAVNLLKSLPAIEKGPTESSAQGFY
ncbi:S41 family peptidase, partial [Candidatus Aerophobetes bacterium]|nr:S41 family peptidase [Candidatus Aerophobetes bacterium]